MGRYRISAIALALTGALFAGAPAAAQNAPADLTVMPPVPDSYTPKTTAWGDPDFTGMWPINDIAEIPVSRPDKYGNRFFKTDEEMKQESARDQQLQTGYKKESTEDKIGLGHWIEYLGGNRRTSIFGLTSVLKARGIWARIQSTRFWMNAMISARPGSPSGNL